MEKYKINREILKGDLWNEWDGKKTDQSSGVEMPEQHKAIPENASLIDLISPDKFKVGKASLVDLIAGRRSVRKFSTESLSLEELSFLLWSTQGVSGKATRQKTAPSAGARHPFETYLVINRVENVKAGLYRYIPLDHKLLYINEDDNYPDKISEACLGQIFCGKSAVMFFWTTIPYRTEWRYGEISHKMIALDAGHLCQNLYLASEAIGAGTCGIGAYDHKKVDSLLGVDGIDEFAVYLAPVGKKQ